MKCESCEMPMEKPEDHGGGQEDNKCCVNCCGEDGSLKSREEIREGWIGYIMKAEGKSREEAEKTVDETMSKMPAWKE